VLDLIQERYRDFGPTLAHEKLTEVHGIKISRESVRKLMIEEEIWKPKRAKASSTHQMRERRACFGELVQIDGSDHAWFENRGPGVRCCVHRRCHGQLLELWFVPEETFFGYCEASRHYFERYGSSGLLQRQTRHLPVNQPRPLGTTSA